MRPAVTTGVCLVLLEACANQLIYEGLKVRG